ncbi:BF3164 family lipoprotein [Aquimarina gracilis]|uniref:BF3164 family lipoprotein n=1 Tax=Aquimarina gracilis TaxID=874422 RepID=A0ABU5ZQR8_9FLAO|nr:BF3164 family lipoprotein [Aquimarina gracilis]MEB3344269.1 BF3164 family lipoprotein [Aquimarina gracilis]
MNKQILKFYTLFVVVFLSCNVDKANNKIGKKEIVKLNITEEPKSIEGELIAIEGFVSPNRMNLQDSILFVKDSRAEKYIHLVDLKNKMRLTSFGIKGKGPGELLSASSMDFYGNRLWVHDLTLGKFVSFDKDSILNNLDGSYKYTDEIQFKEKARQNHNPTWLNDSTTISTTFSESMNRLILTNSQGKVSDEVFEMIPPQKKDTPRAIHNQSYQGKIQKHPSQNKIAVVNRYSDLLEIYDLENETSKLIKTHQNFTPIYEVIKADGNLIMGQDETTRFGCIDISATNDKIFTLYSGRKRGEGFANYANKIYVYDWKGNYLSSYRIPDLAIGILAQNNNTLLTLEYNKDGMGMLKRYILNEK